jgi:DNA-binding CsgD family transcriptional regulator
MVDSLVGLPGIDQLQSGDHVCGLYRGEAERDALLVPYLQAGLHSGDHCLCLIDQITPADVLDRVSNGVDARVYVESNQLEVDRATNAYLRSGRFSSDDMIDFLAAKAKSSTSNGRNRLRAVGEMSWVLPTPPGAEEFFEYESALNSFVSKHPPVLLCLYDLNVFGGTLLVDLLQTHPKVLLGGMVLTNPNYLTPKDYLAVQKKAQSSAHSSADRDWARLTAAERVIADHVARGLTNAAIAQEVFVSPHTVDAHLKHIYTKLGLHSRVQLTRLVLEHMAEA